jgi:hypothetical protein
MTTEQMKARIAELEAQVAKKNASRVTLKTTEKGGLSLYGLGRFPVTLYREQWERLLAHGDEIKAAIAKLPLKADAVKPETKPAPTANTEGTQPEQF